MEKVICIGNHIGFMYSGYGHRNGFFHVESITIRFAMAYGNVAQEQLSDRDEILAQSKVKQYIASDRRIRLNTEK
ncbi:hypothetical protein ACQKOM_02695 [Peribacillus frigoritolerans]|uniref:hypothetical protein n=1 Tax=Peribacillus frigoritolerans TaxID=450367 RepID=UPI003CFCF214